MSNYIFDTHSHYDDKAFDSDRDEILNGLFEKGIGKVVDVGADMPSSKMALELAKQYEFVYAALGVHPSEVEGLTEDDMAWISSHAAHEKVAAIGEIGLDYYWHKEEHEHEIQKKMFRAQMEIAREAQMPFMIHSREAAKDTLDIFIVFLMRRRWRGSIWIWDFIWELAVWSRLRMRRNLRKLWSMHRLIRSFWKRTVRI